MSNTNIRIGLTENHPCSYLPEQEERIAVVLDDDCHSAEHYALFLANGFRRSGNMIYKPHCDECNACQSIRLSVNHIQLSKSQKRIRNKAAGLRWVFQSELDPQWFDLYEQYINQRRSIFMNNTSISDTALAVCTQPTKKHLTNFRTLIGWSRNFYMCMKTTN